MRGQAWVGIIALALLAAGCRASGPSDTPTTAAAEELGAPVCSDLVPDDPGLLGPDAVLFREMPDQGSCQFVVDPDEIATGTSLPAYVRVAVSVFVADRGAASYEEVVRIVREDPRSAASHLGHEVVATAELAAPGWTFGFLSKSRSVDHPGVYADDEVATAVLVLIAGDRRLTCRGELELPGVTIADARRGSAALLRYCDAVKDELLSS